MGHSVYETYPTSDHGNAGAPPELGPILRMLLDKNMAQSLKTLQISLVQTGLAPTQHEVQAALDKLCRDGVAKKRTSRTRGEGTTWKLT